MRGGSIENNLEWLQNAIGFLRPGGFGNIDNKDAAKNDYPGKVTISTDPPYYDNIGYADLSDFFYGSSSILVGRNEDRANGKACKIRRESDFYEARNMSRFGA